MNPISFTKKSVALTICILFLLFGIAACQDNPQGQEAAPTTTITIEILPTLTTIQTQPSCKETKGSVGTTSFQSLVLGKQEKVRVYLPACYDPIRRSGYPVLYLLHAQKSTDDQWQQLGAVAEADELISEEKRLPFLMVMPFDEDNLQPSAQSKFGEMVINELIPWLDKTYHTCMQKSCRGIAGLSRGAAWAMHEALSHPNLFEGVAAHSLPPFEGDNKLISAWLKGISIPDLPRIWIDAGRGDLFLPQARVFEESLTQNGIPHEFYIYAGYHDESYWQSHMKEYIQWSTAAWQ